MKAPIYTLIFLFSLTAFAQSPEEIDLSTATDDLLTSDESSINYEEVMENYLQLVSNPIDLNNTSATQLRSLRLLTEAQITALLNHVSEAGSLLAVQELQAIPGFDLATIQKILPFVMVSDPGKKIDSNFARRLFGAKTSYAVLRYASKLPIDISTPYDTSRGADQGSPYQLYGRLRSSRPNDYSIGLTFEKDVGESFEWARSRRKYGFDYISSHLQISNKGKLRNLIIGDFQYQFGQGLVLGNGFGLGKGGETITSVRKSNIGFSPYTSVNESGYMRGVAGSFNLSSNVMLSAFYSNTLRDASLSDSGLPSFSSIATTGLHRNENEMQNRKSLREENTGVVLGFESRKAEAGMIFNAIRYDIPLQRRKTPYNQFGFSGDNNVNASAYFSYTLANASVIGEYARSVGAGTATLVGIIASVTRDADLSILFRNYDRNYYPFYGNGFSENTTTQNETGLYWGTKIRMTRRITLSGYADIFRFPWLKFGTYRPSIGYETLGRLQYQPSKTSVLYIQFRREKKSRNTSSSESVYKVSDATKDNLVINADIYVLKNLRIKGRVQTSRLSSHAVTTGGSAISLDLIYKINKWKLSGRHAIFGTDNFDNRQYSYENDVLLSYSLPAYNGVGVRNFFMVEYKASGGVTVWMRYSRSSVQKAVDIQTNSSGLSEEIKCQLMIRL